MAVSPQSPVTAYFAVAFQGIIGALIFEYIKNQNLASYITAIFCLIETALQKLLVLLILFGTSFIDASDVFIADIFKKLNMEVNSFSTWILWIYLSIYFLWAIYIGYICTSLPLEMQMRQAKFMELGYLEQDLNIDKKKKNIWLSISIIAVGLALIFVLALTFKSELLMIAFYRTLIIIFLWWALSPLIKKTIFYFLGKKRVNYSNDFSSTFSLLPKMKSKIRPAFNMAKADVKGIAVYKEFVFNILALSLYQDGTKK
jgi:hypothetical protein